MSDVLRIWIAWVVLSLGLIVVWCLLIEGAHRISQRIRSARFDIDWRRFNEALTREEAQR